MLLRFDPLDTAARNPEEVRPACRVLDLVDPFVSDEQIDALVDIAVLAEIPGVFVDEIVRNGGFGHCDAILAEQANDVLSGLDEPLRLIPERHRRTFPPVNGKSCVIPYTICLFNTHYAQTISTPSILSENTTVTGARRVRQNGSTGGPMGPNPGRSLNVATTMYDTDANRQKPADTTEWDAQYFRSVAARAGVRV